MPPDTSTLQASIDRCLAEVNNAILKQVARDTLIRQEIAYVRMSFFVIAEDALYSDMISHAIRVLDEHRDATSFWYILRCNEAAVRCHSARNSLDIEKLKALSAKLRLVREKTKFHIDRAAVRDPKQVWKDADITGAEFIAALHSIAVTLAGVRAELFGGELHRLTEYDASDVPKIVKAYETLHGNVHGA
jgi:hypothetical protein